MEDADVKVGIEIHQQLDTHKLFCSCPSELSDEYDFEFERIQRPVVSELGEIDIAALMELRKGKKFIYRASRKNTCAVEWDEEPPHMPNKEAIKIALQIAKALKAKIVDEIHFMRKMIVDGSVVSGFQRTALIAYDGNVDGVHIESICLEEDSARPMGEKEDAKIFLLDRLGIPLVEITTAPDMHSGEEAQRIARRIGEILRMAKVKRGLGTIRQDLNVSVKGGARVEIKGVQELDMIKEIVEKEVKRQKALIRLLPRIKSLTFGEIKDVSKVFENSKCKILKGKKVFGMCIKGASGLFAEMLHEGKHFGKEIAEYVKAFGYKGFIHSDEVLEKYGISEEEVKRVKEILECKEGDLFAISARSDEPLKLIKERLEMFKKGIPKETRKAKEDGSTAFMRPLPGGARLYPETDIPPIEPFEVEPLEMPEERLKRLKKRIGEYFAKILYLSKDYEVFKRLGEDEVAASFVVNTLPVIRRKGLEFKEEIAEKVINAVREGKIGKDAMYEAYKSLMEGKEIGSVNIDEVRKIVRRIVEERIDYVISSENPVKGLMGVIMKEFKGKVPGKLVAEILKEEVERVRKDL